MNNSYLVHHGIKGMHWGVRRYQNPDGSYTAEGKKRYGHEIATREEQAARIKDYKKAANKRSLYEKSMGVITPEMLQASQSAANAKAAVALAKTRDRVANEDQSKKSKARLVDEKKYQEKGYSKEDAAIAAYNKERAKKLLMVAGGVALVGAAYAAYKYHDNNMDHFIDSNTTLFRLARNGSDQIHDGFYATSSKSDARKYVGLMTKQMDKARENNFIARAFTPENDWHQKTIKSVGKIKIAGDKAGRSVLSEMLKSNNSGAKDDLREAMEGARFAFARAGGVTQAARIDAGLRDLKRGKLDSKRLYNAMNMAMPMTDRDGEFRKSFTDALKKRGYGGIVDVNDRSFSGYHSKRPMILFDSDQFKVTGNRKVGKVEQNVNYGIEDGKMLGKTGAKVGAAVAGVNVVKNQRNARRVRNYRREHPNTKLTDAQILDALDKQ